MVIASLAAQEDYWDDFQLEGDDVEFIYAHLLETEIEAAPLNGGKGR